MASPVSASDPRQTARRALGGIHCSTRRKVAATKSAATVKRVGRGVGTGVSVMSGGLYDKVMVLHSFPRWQPLSTLGRAFSQETPQNETLMKPPSKTSH